MRRMPPPLSCARWAGLFVATLTILIGCARRETNVERANRDQVLLIGVDADLAELDPQLGNGLAEFNTSLALFEGLTDLDPRTLEVVPALADRWHTSADGLVWTFHLREGLQWSDGTPLTAHDVIDSWRRLLQPAMACEYAALLSPVVNAEAFHGGQLANFDKVGIKALDAATVELRLTHPAPHLLEKLAVPPLFPVPLADIARCGPTDRRGNNWTRPATFVGSGPFVLREWHPGQVVVVERNPRYRDAAQVRLNGARIVTVENLETEERMFRSGQLHIVSALAVTRVAAWQRDNPAVLRHTPYFGTEFLRVNITQPALADRRVRQALSLSVDRAQMVERALNATKLPATSLVPPGIAGYTPIENLAFNPEEARQLLTAAGHPGGRDLAPLTILFNSSAQHRAAIEFLQETWRRELGLNVRLENQDNKVVHELRRTGDYQLLRSSWTADYPDPAPFLAVFAAGSTNNFTHWSNAEYDQLLQTAEAETDPAKRAALLHEAEALLLADGAVIPLYHYIDYYLVDSAVRGWQGNPLERRSLKQVWLQP